MKTNNNTPATVPAVLAAFVELSNSNRVDTSASYIIACQAAGAQSAILDKLAEALGGFWMFGADMVEYRAEIVAAVETIKANADEAAKIGECIDNEYYINNMSESVARVMHFADKTDNHTEPAATEEESNDAPAATEEESNDAPAAGSFEMLLKEREEIAELLRISEGTVAILTPRLEAAKAEARAAAGRNDRHAWSDAETRALEISNRLDDARAFVDMDRANLEALDARLAVLRSQLADITAAALATAEPAEEPAQDNTTEEPRETLATRAADILNNAAHRAAAVARKAVAVGLLCLVCVVAFAIFAGLVNVASVGLDAVGIHGAARVSLCVVLLFTVILDLCIWFEINALALIGRTGLFVSKWGENTLALDFCRPFSVVGHIVREMRQ